MAGASGGERRRRTARPWGPASQPHPPCCSRGLSCGLRVPAGGGRQGLRPQDLQPAAGAWLPPMPRRTLDGLWEHDARLPSAYLPGVCTAAAAAVASAGDSPACALTALDCCCSWAVQAVAAGQRVALAVAAEAGWRRHLQALSLAAWVNDRQTITDADELDRAVHERWIFCEGMIMQVCQGWLPASPQPCCRPSLPPALLAGADVVRAPMVIAACLAAVAHPAAAFVTQEGPSAGCRIPHSCTLSVHTSH